MKLGTWGWTLLTRGVVVGILFLATAASSAASTDCNPSVKQAIIAEYIGRYHHTWGMLSKREDVDRMIDSLAKDIDAILAQVRDEPSCRFETIISRAPPESGPFGLRVAPGAEGIAIVLQVTTAPNGRLCVGLNNEEDRALPPDKNFPHQINMLEVGPFTTQSTQYAMKCFAYGEHDGRYLFY